MLLRSCAIPKMLDERVHVPTNEFAPSKPAGADLSP